MLVFTRVLSEWPLCTLFLTFSSQLGKTNYLILLLLWVVCLLGADVGLLIGNLSKIKAKHFCSVCKLLLFSSNILSKTLFLSSNTASQLWERKIWKIVQRHRLFAVCKINPTKYLSYSVFYFHRLKSLNDTDTEDAAFEAGVTLEGNFTQ